jgi:hypothetical protein
VEGGLATSQPQRPKSPHLMCRTRFWGISAAVACCYFAYTGYAQLRDGDYSWHHEWWTVLTWAVWVLLFAGVLTETRCWREHIFFSLVLINFVIGLTFAWWSSAPFEKILIARRLSIGLWIVSAIASLGTVISPQGTLSIDSK